MENGFLDVISVNVDNVNLEEDVKKESVYYKPKQEGKEPYKALVRFLPIPVKEDGKIVGVEELPYYMKKRYWLTDETGNGNYYDSPVTVGEKCPIQSTFFRLWNSEDVREKKMAENFNLSTHYWGLVYILDDKQNPELVGKTLIWRFTNEVKKMIEKELEPSEYKKNAKVAVWDLIDGKNFLLNVGEKRVVLKGKERVFPNYENCEFLDVAALEVDGYELKKGDSKSNQLTMDLLNNVPEEIYDLKYKPWSKETTDEVNKILSQYNAGGSVTSSTAQVADTGDDVSTTEEVAKEEGENLDEADNIIKNLDF